MHDRRGSKKLEALFPRHKANFSTEKKYSHCSLLPPDSAWGTPDSFSRGAAQPFVVD